MNARLGRVPRIEKHIPEDLMRTASYRYCLPVFLAFAIPATAGLTYKVKSHEADLFRTEALEPPPLATLAEGEVLKLIHEGAASSLLETEGGIKGWMRNSDLLAMKSTEGQDFRLKEQVVNPGGRVNVSPIIPGQRFDFSDMVPLDRAFEGEIAEPMDREQVEMRHDEN